MSSELATPSDTPGGRVFSGEATPSGMHAVDHPNPHKENGSVPTDTPGPPIGAPNFDWDKEGRKGLESVRESLNVSKELPQLKSEELRKAVQKLVDRLISKIDALIGQGANASASQVLVVVLTYSGSEDELKAASEKASDADRQILEGIRDKFVKVRIPFWTALASLGKVKEWSAKLEISADLFAVKGTGGISITFGR